MTMEKSDKSTVSTLSRSLVSSTDAEIPPPPPSAILMMRSDDDEIERNRSLEEQEPPKEVLNDSTFAAQNAHKLLTRSTSGDLVASTAALVLNDNDNHDKDFDSNSLVIQSDCLGSNNRQSLRARLQKSLRANRQSQDEHDDGEPVVKDSHSKDDSSWSTGSTCESSGILLSYPNEDDMPASTTTTSSTTHKQQSPTILRKTRSPSPATICEMYSQAASPPPRKTNLVKLHIYDLIASATVMQVPWVGCHFPIGKCFSAVNNGLHALGTGAYHCGIEVNGVEYAYGANEVEGLSGVFTCIPKHSPGYEYRTTLDFGHIETMKRTWIKVPKVEIVEVPLERPQDDQDYPPPIEVNASSVYRQHATFIHGHAVMRQMAREYMGRDYDLLKKNCCTFARDACLRLGVPQEEIPTWFLNLADAGAVTKDMAENSFKPFSSCHASDEPRIVSAPTEVPCIDRGFEVVGDDLEALKVIDVDGSLRYR